MKTHQHVWKCLQQVYRGSFVGRLSIGAVLGLLLLVATFAVNVPGAQAHTRITCPRGNRTYIVVWGDTLSKIAYRYGTNWPLLASYNHIPNANLIYPDQVVCIPPRGTVVSTQVRQYRFTTYSTHVQRSTPVIHNAPLRVQQSTPVYNAPQKVQQSVPVVQHSAALQVQPGTPVVYTPVVYNAPPQSQESSASVTSMIDQVFGPYAPGAINVARCESGLNPSAYNGISVGGSHAEGVFQILYPSTWAGTSEAASSPYNAWANIVAAHQIFVRDGYSWREWVCQP